MLSFILFADILSASDNIDKQLFDIGKQDLMLHEFGKFSEFIQPSGFIEPLGFIIYTNNIYKRMNNIGYTLEKKTNDPFGKNIPSIFYRVNHPFVWFNLPPIEFAN